MPPYGALPHKGRALVSAEIAGNHQGSLVQGTCTLGLSRLNIIHKTLRDPTYSLRCSATVSIVTVLHVLQAVPAQGNTRRDSSFADLN